MGSYPDPEAIRAWARRLLKHLDIAMPAAIFNTCDKTALGYKQNKINTCRTPMLILL